MILSYCLLVLFLIVCCGLAVLYYIRHLRLEKSFRYALIALRAVILACVAGLFFQPVFHFKRLAHRDQNLLVLIDNSKSMSRFGVHSAVDSLCALVQRSDKITGLSGSSSPIFCFGDSTRPLPAHARPNFNDSKSYFPAMIDNDNFRSARRVLIVSDANWSNAALPQALFEEKECFYLVLPPATPYPYLRAEAASVQLDVPFDSVARPEIYLSGNLTRAADVSVICLKGRAVAAERVKHAAAGFFTDTVVFNLKTLTAGKHLYRVIARCPDDSLIASCFFMLNVIPGHFTVAAYSALPRLDNRFLTLAFDKNPAFQTISISPGSGDKPDVLVLFDWNVDAEALTAAVKPGGLIITSGCLPCAAQKTVELKQYQLFWRDQATPVFSPKNPPPLSSISFCKDLKIGNQNIRASVLCASTADTLPLIFTTRYKNKPVLALAGRDLWKWDFLPQAFETDSAAENAFSAYIIALVKEQLVNNISNTYAAWPGRLPVYENEPVPFLFTFPSSIKDEATAEIALNITTPDKKTLFDTLFHPAVSGSNQTSITVHPFASGHYFYRSTLRGDGVLFSCSDSLPVEFDNSEYLVMGQNTALLDQFARPVSRFDTALIKTLIESPAPATGRQFETFSIQFKQSWWTFGLLLLLFTVEWLLRKKLMIE